MTAARQREPERGRVPAGRERGHLGARAGHLAQRAVHEQQRVVRAAAAAPARPQRAEGDRAARSRPRAGPEAVGEGDPDAVEVLDDVEPVAGDLVRRQHVAGHLAPADARDARRQQALLDLRRGQRLLAPLPAGERVGVAVRERDRRGGLTGQLLERVARPAQRDQRAGRAPAEPERDDLDPRPVGQRGAQLREAGAVELRADRERGGDPLGQALGPRHAQQVRAVDVEHVEARAARRRAARPRRRAARAASAGRRRRRRGSPPARRAARGPAGPAAASGRDPPPARPAPAAGSPRGGCRDRGSGGRASSARRRRPRRCPPPASPRTGRAGAGPRRRCARGFGAYPLAAPVRARTRWMCAGRASPPQCPRSAERSRDRTSGLGVPLRAPSPLSALAPGGDGTTCVPKGVPRIPTGTQVRA